ncbi:DNA-methyltransferase [Burkholderia contaminans]|uniref:DNA-methyltransferase n=1 Tax=Burkholderia contaminans TaxID=488447 RepID=UPI000F563670|nr:site-specific DNA-methyltransferase [Burkholderia contaminans]RQT24077.1 site-specific DNA-methyltransferase [Burkholderia contaminans]
MTAKDLSNPGRAKRRRGADQNTEPVAKEVSPVQLPRTASRAYHTHGGAYYVDDSKKILTSKPFERLTGKVQLILTSPPYPLNEKKSYGNLTGDKYLKWIESLATIFSKLLTDDGSIVIELGNSWEPNRPVQSLLALEALLAFTKAKDAGLRLIQQFACYNPSRLPSPASWVTVRPLRTVDSFTHVWWLAKTDYPKADNRKVLRPYSEAMKNLLKRGAYNSGARPSEHHVSKKGFLNDRGGSIPHNFFELEQMESDRLVRLPNAFSLSNTASTDFFHKACRERNIVPHPARMPVGLASFFIEYLTDAGDLVLDPFGGSNTTGYASALSGRRWVAIDAQKDYVEQSKLRFLDPLINETTT